MCIEKTSTVKFSLPIQMLFSFLYLILTNPAWAGIAPPGVDGVTASPSGNDVLLIWSATNTDLYGSAQTIASYNVYRGTTPDFVPDYVAGSNRIAQPASNSYTDVSALTAPDSFYYVMTAVSSVGDESLVASNVAHKIRRDLVFDEDLANRHWLSLPTSSSWSSASELGSAAPNITRVIRWDAASRSEQIWDVVAASGTDFSITPGEAYAIEISADTTLNLIGTSSAASLALSHNASDFNHHWISVPQPNAYGEASALANELPDVTKIAKYDDNTGSYQSWFQLDGQWMGDDFTLTPGMGVVVSIASATQWQPASGSPSAQTVAVPDQGYESVTVDLTGAVTDINGSIASYQWDFEGDGTFDFTSGISANATHTYTTPGTFYPTLLVTDNHGHRALAYTTLTISSLNVNFSLDGFSPLNGETTDIGFHLPVAGTLTLLIYDQMGNLIRTLVDQTAQSAGSKSYQWDGKDASDQVVSDGSYYVVIEFKVEGHTSLYDTRSTSGNVDITGGLSGVVITNTLYPLTGDYVNINYTLPENALVDILIRDQAGNLIKNLLDQVLRPAGNHTEVWDGSDNNGHPVAPGTSFNVSISSTSLPSNSLVALGSQPKLTGVSASPLRFSPATNPYGSQLNRQVSIDFSLNKTADVTATVLDHNGVVIFTQTTPNLTSGSNTIIWSGRNNGGVLMAAGNYTVRLRAEDQDGLFSEPFNLLTELFY